MADDDFDIERLAAYLHLNPAQVARLADRGQIPARKVQGQWRFARAEVHHWLESRIGLSDDEELQAMENILRPPGNHQQTPRSIAEMMPLAAISLPLNAKTRNSVITSMAELGVGAGLLWDAQKMADALKAREEMQSTALDIGVALMHPRRPMSSILGEAFVAFGRTSSGIPFGGPHGALTDLFFLICSLDDRAHLQTLARLSRLVGDPALLSQLREAPDAQIVHRIIKAAETKLQE